jgi:hypothetical protein
MDFSSPKLAYEVYTIVIKNYNDKKLDRVKWQCQRPQRKTTK